LCQKQSERFFVKEPQNVAGLLIDACDANESNDANDAKDVRICGNFESKDLDCQNGNFVNKSSLGPAGCGGIKIS